MCDIFHGQKVNCKGCRSVPILSTPLVSPPPPHTHTLETEVTNTRHDENYRLERKILQRSKLVVHFTRPSTHCDSMTQLPNRWRHRQRLLIPSPLITDNGTVTLRLLVPALHTNGPVVCCQLTEKCNFDHVVEELDPSCQSNDCFRFWCKESRRTCQKKKADDICAEAAAQPAQERMHVRRFLGTRSPASHPSQPLPSQSGANPEWKDGCARSQCRFHGNRAATMR